jgi:predicted DNA-binding protein
MKKPTIKRRFGAIAPPLEKRTCYTSLRLTTEEANKTAALAAANGKTISAFVRDTMLAGGK